jgi:REP element-mobilizing transposase RayT
MMSPDGRVSDKHGWTDVGDAAAFVGLTIAEARKKIVAEFKARGLLADTKPYRQNKTFSDRSKAEIEPYLSDQWYVMVTDPRLAQAANAALAPEQRSSGGTALQSGAQSPLPSIATLDRALDSFRFDLIRQGGFVGKDPYPPGEPTPGFIQSICNLPHIEMPGATYFVTWRLAPATAELSDSDRSLVLTSLMHPNEGTAVFAAVVMPDHVHALVKPSGPLGDWVASVKKFTARRINEARITSGALWQDERFDHVVRNETWLREFLRYIIRNPAEASLCSVSEPYPHLALHACVRTALESGATKGTTDASLRFFPAATPRPSSSGTTTSATGASAASSGGGIGSRCGGRLQQ